MQTLAIKFHQVTMLSQNSRQGDFVLGNCPNCQKVVRIPVTAVTSQSRSQVRCPICAERFEIADFLEEMIPSVEVVDDELPRPTVSIEPKPEQINAKPERINAIDTPELFHVSKQDYQPKTEKRNGRFVVPELLSKGIRQKKKRSRRKSHRDDKRLAESLEKLKKNTASTSMNHPGLNQVNTQVSEDIVDDESRTERERSRSRRSRSSDSQSDRTRSSGSSQDSARRRNGRESHGRTSSRKKSGKPNQRWIERLKDADSSKKLEWAMIGTGVLLAVPLIHVVLWWTIGIDPLGLSRPTSFIAPVLVPESMQVRIDNSVPDDTDLVTPVAPQNNIDEDGSSESFDSTSLSDFSFSDEPPDGKLPTPNIDPSSIHPER